MEYRLFARSGSKSFTLVREPVNRDFGGSPLIPGHSPNHRVLTETPPATALTWRAISKALPRQFSLSKPTFASLARPTQVNCLDADHPCNHARTAI